MKPGLCFDVRDVVGTAVLAIVCGSARHVHINRLRNDTALAALPGLGRIVCEDSVRRALKSADGRELDAWRARHEKDVFDRLPSSQYVVDIDNTVKPVFGHREGAELRRGREHVRGGKARTQEPVRPGRIRHEGSEAVPRNRTAHRHRGQLVEHLLPAGGRRQAPGTDDISSNVHGHRRTVFAAIYSSKAFVFGDVWMSIRYKIIDSHPNLSLPTGKMPRLHGEWRVR